MVVRGWYSCWTDATGTEAEALPAVRVLVPEVYAPWLVPTLRRFSIEHGVALELTVQPLSQILPSILADADLPVAQQHAVWLQTTLTTQHLADTGRAVDISQLTFMHDSSLQWADILQLFRLQLASYRGVTYAMPLDGSTLYMLAQRHVLDRLVTQVPETWQGLLNFVVSYRQLAAAADVGGDAAGLPSLPPYPLCLPRGATCRQLSLLQAIWSSIAQTNGSQQGVHFDTASGTPLLDTPAGREAFRIMAHLLAASAPPEPDETCSHGSLAFARGKCALAIAGFVPQLRMLILPEYNDTVSMGSLQLHPVPGSSVVWVRGSNPSGGQLQACTKKLCPYATGDSAALVNHAPLSPGSNLAGMLNSRQPPIVQYLGYTLLEYLASPERYGAAEQPPLLQSVAPVREQYVSASSVDPWVAAGYNRTTMLESMPTLHFSREHPNRAWDLRMPYHMLYYDVLGGIVRGIRNGSIAADDEGNQERAGLAVAAASGVLASSGSAVQHAARRSLLQGPQQPDGLSPPNAPQIAPAAPPKAGSASSPQQAPVALHSTPAAPPSPARPHVVTSLTEALRVGQASLVAYYDPEVFLPKYLDSLAILHATHNSSSGSEGASATGSALGATTSVALAVSGLAFVTFVACGLWLTVRRGRRGQRAESSARWAKRLMDTSKHGYSAEPVALVITDIQDSTSLWEALPPAVMAEAVQLHHATVRRLLRAHGGYESSTEGDSFILAFRSVKRATTFALDLQAQLLQQPWPEELLQQPGCNPICVDLPEGFPFASSRQLQRRRSMRGGGAYSRRSLLSSVDTGAAWHEESVRSRQASIAPGSAVGGGGLFGSASFRHGSPSGSVSGVAAWLLRTKTGLLSSAYRAPSASGPSISRLAQPPPSLPPYMGRRSTVQELDSGDGTGTSAHTQAPLRAAHTSQLEPARRGGGGGSGLGTVEGGTEDGFLSSTGGEGTTTGDGEDCGDTHTVEAAAAAMAAALRAPLASESPSARRSGASVSFSSGLAAAGQAAGQDRTPRAAAGRPCGLDGFPSPFSARALQPAASFAAALAPLGVDGVETSMCPDTQGAAAAGSTWGAAAGADRATPAVAMPPRQRSYEVGSASGARALSAAPLKGQPQPQVPAVAVPGPGSRLRVATAPVDGSAPQAAPLPIPVDPASSRAAAGGPSSLMQTRQRSLELLLAMETLPTTFSVGTQEGDDAGGIYDTGSEPPLVGQGHGQPQQQHADAPASPARSRVSRSHRWRSLLASRVSAGSRGAGHSDCTFAEVPGGGGGGGESGSPASARPSVCGSTGAPGACVSGARQRDVASASGMSGTQRRLTSSEVGLHGTLRQFLDAAAAGAVAPAQQPQTTGGAGPWAALGGQSRGPPCVFRGLRVRVGISWVSPSPSELQYNAAAARMVYGGPCVAGAKAVADMAAGGQVVLSGPALAQLEEECGPGPGGRPGGTMILHLGTYAWPRPRSAGQRGPLPSVFAGQSPEPTGLHASGSDGAAASPVTGHAGTGAATSVPARQLVPPGASVSPFADMAMQSNVVITSSRSLPLVCSSPTRASGASAAAAGTAAAAALPPPEQRAVYWLTSPALSPRLALMPPLRVPDEVTPLCEVYNAPVGRLSYVAVQVPAAPVLLAWNAGVAEEALRLFNQAAAATLQRLGSRGPSYMVPSGVERWKACAAFANAGTAVWWALSLRAELLSAPWPQELLSHELCEVVEAPAAAADPRVVPARTPPALPPAEGTTGGFGVSLHSLQAGSRSHGPAPVASRGQLPVGASEPGMVAGFSLEVASMDRLPDAGAGSLKTRRPSTGQLASLLLRRQASRPRRLSMRSRASGEPPAQGEGDPGAANAESAEAVPAAPMRTDSGGVSGFTMTHGSRSCSGQPRRPTALSAFAQAVSPLAFPLARGARVGPASAGAAQVPAAQEALSYHTPRASASGLHFTRTRGPPQLASPPAVARADVSLEIEPEPSSRLELTELRSGSVAHERPAREPSSSACVPSSAAARAVGSRGLPQARAKQPNAFPQTLLSPLKGRGSGMHERADPSEPTDGDTEQPRRGSTLEPAPQVARSVVLLRGLRMRTGISSGVADWFLHEPTHSLAYTGRPVRTAVKLAAAAASGQVLCDEATRQEALAEEQQVWAAPAVLNPAAAAAPLPLASPPLASPPPPLPGDLLTTGAAATTVAVAALLQAAGAAPSPLLGLTFSPALEGALTAGKKKLLSQAFVCGTYACEDAGAAPQTPAEQRTLPTPPLEPDAPSPVASLRRRCASTGDVCAAGMVELSFRLEP